MESPLDQHRGNSHRNVQHVGGVMKILKWIDDYRSSFACVVDCKGKNYLVIDDSYYVIIYSSDKEGIISKYPELCKIEGKMIGEVIRDNRTFTSNVRIWSKIDRLGVAK